MFKFSKIENVPAAYRAEWTHLVDGQTPCAVSARTLNECLNKAQNGLAQQAAEISNACQQAAHAAYLADLDDQGLNDFEAD